MTPQKRIAAAHRGMINLSPKIKKIQKELAKVSKAFTKLHNMRHRAQLEITPVKKIPVGEGAATIYKKALKAAESVPDDKVAETIVVLEARLAKGGMRKEL